MNYIHLIGRIGKDPALSATQMGHTVCKFPVATSRRWRDKDGEKQEVTTWHNIEAWGTMAETLAKYCHKGDLIQITGRQENQTYEAKDGTKRISSTVVASGFEFLSSPRKEKTEDTGTTTTDDDLPF